jgi:hypothetical protein
MGHSIGARFILCFALSTMLENILFFYTILKSILFFAASTILESILQAYHRLVKATVATFLLHLLSLKSPKKVVKISLCGSDNTMDFIFHARTSLFSLSTVIGGCACLSFRWHLHKKNENLLPSISIKHAIVLTESM